MITVLAELVEAAAAARWVQSLPEWVTALGVMYLVFSERRRARRMTVLEHTTRVLVDGHRGDPEAHRSIPEVLQEAPAHARQ